ncbi:MAG: DUF4404 family protein [Planctomycetaceae bacterium]
MQKQKVSQLLEQLHAELSSAGELDEVTAEKLRSAAEEIETTLAGSGHIHSQPLIQRLRDSVFHLPDSHPAIKNTVGRIADALAQIGI